MKLYLSIFWLTMSFAGIQAQSYNADSVFALPDTVRPFTIHEFYQHIVKYHPVAKQAAMLSEIARQEIRLAKGNFDPKLESQSFIKKYNNTAYYQLFNGSLKFPTRSPISPSIGIERNTGKYLNPENYISDEYNYQQLYTGISIPLGSGLITDERRTALKQAELFREMMEAEQIKVINKLLLDAAKDYWQWYYSYYQYRLASNTARIGEEILRRVKINFEGGEASPIDTVQAKITMLERQVSKQEAFAEWRNHALNVSTYLWDSLVNPLDLPLQYIPVADPETIALSSNTLEELQNIAKINHPELKKLNTKLEQLVLEKRLAQEYMKPKLDLSYYILNQPLSPEGTPSFAVDDNYKIGLDFSIPLFLRKERSKVAQTKLKIASTNLELDLAVRQILNDINTAHNFLLNNGLILQQQRLMVENYSSLMNAELLNLENGESDLFKINVQQEKLFNAQSKLIKVISEYEKQKAVLYWSAGVTPYTL